MTVEPKIVYLANRRQGLADHDFARKWAAHGSLAMSLPIWRNMARYAQCDPVALGALPRPCDAIGLVWYRSLEAMESIAREPSLRQPLLDDELLTFDRHIREVAMLTQEEILRDGPVGGWKVFVFDRNDDPPLNLVRSAGARRAAISRLLRNDYTSGSRLPYRSVLECWFADRGALEAALEANPGLAAGEEWLVAGAFERPLHGYER